MSFAEAVLQQGDGVAIIDDDVTTRRRLMRRVGGWGFTPLPVEGSYRSVPELVNTVRALKPRLVLCDNRLQDTGFAGFYGAEAVVELNKLGDTSILVTSFQVDDETFLRRWRPDVPSVMDKDDLDIENVQREFEKSASEVVLKQKLPERRAFRTFVRALEIDDKYFVVQIPDWNPDEVIRLPIETLGELSRSVSPGSMLIAKVNLGAKKSADVFLKDFELAPELDPEDGLG